MSREHEPYFPEPGSDQLPKFMLGRISEVITGYMSLADLFEWHLLHGEPTKIEQDTLLEDLNTANKAIAYFQDQHEEIRQRYNIPDLFEGYYKMQLEMRRTEPLQPKVPLFCKLFERVLGTKK